jgi:poly(3-hydroxybutyrate) depolymerase
LMRGGTMLRRWKNMHPEEHYINSHIDLYEHIDDPVYLKKEETFESWYENPIDLPGRWYMQAVIQLFKENRLAKGSFIGLGRRLNLKHIICPVYLLAGETDDITTSEQVFDAEKYLGTPKGRIQKQLVPGGHIGLFMGSRTPTDTWPKIARWIRDCSGERQSWSRGHPLETNARETSLCPTPTVARKAPLSEK